MVKKTSILKEPSVEPLTGNRGQGQGHRFSRSRESSMLRQEHELYANESLVKGLETVVPLANKDPDVHCSSGSKKDNLNVNINAKANNANNTNSDKIHTLKYTSGGVLSNKPAQAVTVPAMRGSATTTATTDMTSSATQVIPTSPNKPSLITSDLPYIDESDLELEEAIRDAIGMEQDTLVTSIQLASTTGGSYSNASTLLCTQRSCSGTDTIHMSEKVIKRDYRDL